MKTKNFAVWALQVVLAAVMVCVTSCNDSLNVSEGLVESRSVVDLNRPDPRWETARTECHPVDTGFWHIDTHSLFVSLLGETTKYFAQSKSECAATLAPEVVDIIEDFKVKETSHSHTKTYVGGYEKESWKFNFNDSREVYFTWSSEHPEAVKYSWTDEAGGKHVETYKHGFDSLMNIKFINAYPTSLTKGDVPGKYVKRTDLYIYEFEVTTAPVKGNGEVGAIHTDNIRVKGLSRVWDTNGATATLKRKGSKPISDVEEKDSLEIIITWDDGHKEEFSSDGLRTRDIKPIERRKEIVSALDNEGADSSFGTNSEMEKLVITSDNWDIYEKQGTFVKNCFVHGTVKEVCYIWRQQRSVFKFLNLKVPFDYNDWNFTNVSDDFETVVSDMTGYDEEDYTNRVSANYNGWNHSLSEVIAWYAKAKEIVEDSCVVVNKFVKTDDSYIHFGGDRVIYYSDGTTKNAGKISLDVLWTVVRESDWLIQTDHLGTYVSNDLTLSQISEERKTQGSFTYTQVNKRFKNFVSGKQNSGVVAIVKGCKYNDGKFACSFDDVEVGVVKGNEGTNKTGTESGVDVYSYGCEAIVKYGDGVQRVTLPGTIKVDNRNHEHGKIRATYMTTTPNEDRSFYKSVAVIEFEDGFKKVGMAENNQNSFDFTMTSTSNVVLGEKQYFSAVYADGRWMPSVASDDARCMRWRDESGASRRVLDYITATAQSWNNGHNTVVDVRREGKISADGYSVTFYLNGEPGQTLNF